MVVAVMAKCWPWARSHRRCIRVIVHSRPRDQKAIAVDVWSKACNHVLDMEYRAWE